MDMLSAMPRQAQPKPLPSFARLFVAAPTPSSSSSWRRSNNASRARWRPGAAQARWRWWAVRQEDGRAFVRARARGRTTCVRMRARVSYQGVIEQLNKKNSELVMQVMPRSRLGHSCCLGIADGMSIAWVWTCRYSK